MTCPHCGVPLPDNAAFCANCGHRISQPSMQAPPPGTQPKAHEVQSAPPPQTPSMDFRQMQGTPFFLFAKPLFDAIDRGTFFRKPFLWLYVGLAVINLLYPLYILFKMIDTGMFDYMGFRAVLVLVLVAFAGWVGFQLWWNRKDKITGYGNQGDDFVATPAYTHWFQTAGEYVGTMIAIYGVGLSILALLFSEGRGSMGGMPFGDLGDMGAIGIVTAPVLGFFVIVFTRVLAELLRAQASIANNTKRMAERTQP